MAEILVEVRPKMSARAAGELAPKPAIPEPLQGRLGELSETLKVVSATIGEHLDELSMPPPKGRFRVDEVNIKFNIDLESEAGVVIVRAKASAGFEASITWKRT